MKLSDMTKDERSLLLFLETCAVDCGGLVDVKHINREDMALVKKWDESEFIRFGRVRFDDIERLRIGHTHYTHWCELSELAFTLAHEERRARAVRMGKKRTWVRTDELQVIAEALS